MTITIVDLRDLLIYDPITGILTWKSRSREMFSRSRTHQMWNTRYANTVALAAPDGRGYLHGSIDGMKLRAHRVAWALYHRAWPNDQIDHINGIRTDNRIVNLREVDALENAKNQKLHTTNTSGSVGVHWNESNQKWRARIDKFGKTTHLGYFLTKIDAIRSREAAMESLGYHENHGNR
jgi:hypothetical protein